MTWERVPLRELGQWLGGATPSKSNPKFWSNGSIPWLSPKDMGPMILLETRDHITPDAVAGSSVSLVPADAVAVVVRSGILERTLPVASVPFATTLNQDMKAVVPRPGIDPRWVAWGLRAFERDLLRTTRKTGTTVASIEMSRFYQFKLPVPELAEQLKVIDVIEDHFSHLEVAEAALTQSRQRSLSMVASARRRLVDLAREASVVRTIGELAAVGTGTTPSRSQARYFEGGTIPWITSGDLAQGFVHAATQYVTNAAMTETSLKLYPPGTLLIAMYGEGKTRGMVAELGLTAATNQACAAVQVHDPDLRSWVRMTLEANYLAMRRLAAGGVQPNLNLRLIRSIKVPVPDEATRSRLMGEVNVVLEAARALNLETDRAVARLNGLRRTLLAAAFEGKLTSRQTDADVIEEMANV